MEKFGATLKRFRKATYYPATNKCLSQRQFANELCRVSGIKYSYGTISQWERGKNKAIKNSRYLLLNIVKVLVQFNGIRSLEEANQLLRSAEYRPLNDQEIAQVNRRWVENKPETYLLPPESTQQAALPAQVDLIGRKAAKQPLHDHLLHPNTRVCFITARGGVGKTAIATTLAWEHLGSNTFRSIVWLPFGLRPMLRPKQCWPT